MGLFDFIFGNKKKEEQERLERERQAELQRKENERIAREREARLAENRRKEEERLKLEVEQARSNNISSTSNNSDEDENNLTSDVNKPNTKVMHEDTKVSEYLRYLAGQCNMSFNLRDSETAVKFMNQLFEACYGRNGHKLLQLSTQSTQVVGLSFTYIALYLNFNDEDMNSVAAENAVYCLGRTIIEKNNTFCAPSIFTILFKSPSLLRDKLIAAHSSVSQKRVGMPIGMMLGGNPFTAPHLNEFREQATTEKRIAIMAYMLSLFYNANSDEFTIPTDLPYNLPSNVDIADFLILIKNNIEYDYDTLIREGKEYFYELFLMCQDTLQKMI